MTDSRSPPPRARPRGISHLLLSRAAVAWSLAAVALALGAGSAVLSALAGSEDPWWVVVLGAGTVVTSAAVGLLLTLRRPGNRVGRLLLVNAVLLGLLWVVEGYAQYTVLAHPGALPGGRWAALASDSDFPLLFAGPVAIALAFPDGRLPSPCWRRVPAVMIAIFALTIAFAAISPEPFSAPYEDVSSPAPELSAAIWEPVALPVFLSLLACLVAAIAAVRIRYRRGTGDRAPPDPLVCLCGGPDAAHHGRLPGLRARRRLVGRRVPRGPLRRPHGGAGGRRRRRASVSPLRHRPDHQPDGRTRYSPRCWWARGRRRRSCSA